MFPGERTFSCTSSLNALRREHSFLAKRNELTDGGMDRWQDREMEKQVIEYKVSIKLFRKKIVCNNAGRQSNRSTAHADRLTKKQTERRDGVIDKAKKKCLEEKSFQAVVASSPEP